MSNLVTSKYENIILVNPDDQQIGVIEKIIGHRYAMLHRAFSVLVFRKRNNQLETLVQQRSLKKYHAGGLWTNTCCSHPQPGDDMVASAELRTKIEMGIDVKLKEVGKFHYVAVLDHGLTENEIDHVLIGTYDNDEIPVNSDEVDNYEWMEVMALMRDLDAHPKKYTPWFKQALEIAMAHYK